MPHQTAELTVFFLPLKRKRKLGEPTSNFVSVSFSFFRQFSF